MEPAHLVRVQGALQRACAGGHRAEGPGDHRAVALPGQGPGARAGHGRSVHLRLLQVPGLGRHGAAATRSPSTVVSPCHVAPKAGCAGSSRYGKP